MINPFILKRIGALTFAGMLTTIAFYVGVRIFGSFWIALGLMFVGLILGVLLGSLLLKNPFTEMLEGNGILAFSLDSTGIIHPFIIRVNPPIMFGKIGKREIEDVFDREAVFQLAVPDKVDKQSYYVNEELIDEALKSYELKQLSEIEKEVSKTPDNKKDKVRVAKLIEMNKRLVEYKKQLNTKIGNLVINLPSYEYNKGRFAFFHYPLLIFNEQVGSVLTKDWLSTTEKTLFTEHTILYLNRKVEELSSHIRDFGRYVVETLKPKESFLNSKWVGIIIVVFIIILLVLFAPSLLKVFQGGVGGSVEKAVSNAGQTITINRG